MCMCEQDTWSLRLLLLGGSWGKSPNTGEILCCWAGLNFTSLSAPDCGQTNGTSFFGPGLIVQLGCLMSTSSVHWCVLQWWPRCTGQVFAAAAKHRDLMCSQQPHPTDPGYGAVETLL